MTLPRFFALILGALALLAGLVLTLAVRTAGQAVIRTGEAARVARASQVATAIEADLSVAERAVEDFEQALANHVVDDRDPTSVRRYLTAELIAQRNLTDLTLTSGQLSRYGDEGEAVLSAQGRWQASALRDSAGMIQQRLVDHVVPDGKSDPTLHDTFRAAANRECPRSGALERPVLHRARRGSSARAAPQGHDSSKGDLRLERDRRRPLRGRAASGHRQRHVGPRRRVRRGR